MKTLNDIIKIELTTLATNEKKSFNGKIYGDLSIYINDEKYMIEDYNTTGNAFLKALKEAKDDFYTKELDFEDDENPTQSMLNYINSKY